MIRFFYSSEGREVYTCETLENLDKL